MKKSIIAALLILGVFAGFAFSQTKKRTAASGAKTTVKKAATTKTTTPKTIVTTQKTASVTTASGLTYIITQKGTGAQLKAGDTVMVHYTGLLTSGKMFDSSVERGEPISFELGAGKVIKGWDEALQKLRVGDRATLIIPPAIGYGSRGAGGVIPPDATLIFIVEVVGVR
ncbi:MAG TPA: FKBP-type peptidyl-prolyl cis-trans isomerase [Pyrinomonadaceae bacterium]|jgi:peptidylprolyl isomerase